MTVIFLINFQMYFRDRNHLYFDSKLTEVYSLKWVHLLFSLSPYCHIVTVFMWCIFPVWQSYIHPISQLSNLINTDDYIYIYIYVYVYVCIYIYHIKSLAPARSNIAQYCKQHHSENCKTWVKSWRTIRDTVDSRNITAPYNTMQHPVH